MNDDVVVVVGGFFEENWEDAYEGLSEEEKKEMEYITSLYELAIFVSVYGELKVFEDLRQTASGIMARDLKEATERLYA